MSGAADRHDDELTPLRRQAAELAAELARLGPECARLQALADALPLFVSFIDPDERYRFVNRPYEAWFGRPREEIIGSTIREAIGEEPHAARREYIARALAGEAVRFTALMPDRKGGWLDTDIHYVPLRGPDGRVEGFHALLADITEERAAQRALMQAREQAEREAAQTAAILAQLAEGVIVTDTNGRITFINDAAARIHGSAPLDVAPEDYTAAFHLLTEAGEPYPPTELPLARAALRGETVEDARWRVRRPDGREVIAVGTARPILRDGVRVGAVLTMRDDTARATAAAELQRLNTRLEAEVAERTEERDRIWENSNELMGVFGFDGRRRAINPAWSRTLGVDEETLLTTPFMEITHPEDRPRLAAAVGELRAGARIVEFEDRLRHADGSYRTISWTGVPVGELFYAIGRDVTEQRAAEDALRQAQKMEAVGQLTGGIAHDFNNLLAGIVGSLDLMQKRISQGRTAELDRYITAAMTSAQRAAALTHRLLAFSRRQPLDPKSVDANKLVAGMEELLSRTLGPAISLDLSLHGGLWPVLCDPAQLESTLLNLCINARDAMPDGGRLTIETDNARLDKVHEAARRELAPGDYVVICVTDTGVGMTPQVVARAFEPFFTTKPIGQGTGLGLSMVYGFTQQSGGHVRIASELGTGTTVKLYLPRHEGAAEAESVATRPDVAPRSGAGETVLVIEDEPGVRSVVVEALSDLGYAVLEATDGPEGLRVLQSRQRIDLLVTDVGLPGLNGRQVAEQARETRPALRVLFITGYAESALGRDFLSPGMALITKPFAVDAFSLKVRELIDAPG